jgi:hypothetical protein
MSQECRAEVWFQLVCTHAGEIHQEIYLRGFTMRQTVHVTIPRKPVTFTMRLTQTDQLSGHLMLSRLTVKVWL